MESPSFENSRFTLVAILATVVFFSLVIVLLLVARYEPDSLPSKATLEEGIVSYRSDVEIGKDGSLKITDNIRVRVAGKKIRRGIALSFQKRAKKQDGSFQVYRFELLDVAREGQVPKMLREESQSMLHIRIYEPGLLPHGEHTYTLQYRIWGTATSHPAYDEIERHVTGKWTFPILFVQAEIVPPPFMLAQHMTYQSYILATPSGFQSSPSKDHMSKAAITKGNTLIFKTLRPVMEGEHFVLRLRLPKGFLQLKQRE